MSTPLRTPASYTNNWMNLSFVISQLIGRVITIVPVRVQAIHNGGSLDSDPYVDVLPLLEMTDGASTGTPYETIYTVPVFRLRSGTAAILVDPFAGDVGLMLVAYRDTANLVAADEASSGSLQNGTKTYQPGSLAQYDWGSGFYLGGALNGAVEQYLQITASLIKGVAPTINLNGVTIDSSGDLSAHELSAANGASGTVTTETGYTLVFTNGILTSLT